MIDMHNHHCRTCGKPFTTKVPSWGGYCSEEHRQMGKARHRQQEIEEIRRSA